LIESPTGSGKTVMGLLTAFGLQRQLGLRVGWVAMRRNLLTQAAAENAAHRIGVKAEFISMFEKDPPAGLDLVVMDEAQHDAAASMAHLYNRIKPRFILGLSATPFRADRMKLCFDRVIKDAGIQQLIQDGYLSPYHHYTIPTYNPQAAAELYLREPQQWGQSILYFHTLDQCRAAHDRLAAGGVRAEVVTGASDRQAQIDAFRVGTVQVLLNCMVLAEGFDCPELRTVFCRPSCKGVTIQMCGRVLRKHAALPFKQIVQCEKTRWPFHRTATPAQQFIPSGGEWRTLKINPCIEQVARRTLRALAVTSVQLPPWVTRRKPYGQSHSQSRTFSGGRR
jgi:superfamily II DNA or RNA helicase